MGECLSVQKSNSIVPIENRNINIKHFYDIKNKIGTGASCEVFRGFDKITKQEVAIKFLKKSKLMKNLFQREVIGLNKLKSQPNIVKYHKCFETKREYCMVFEYIKGQELLARINNYKRFNEIIASKIIEQMLIAVKSCHDIKIAHRDIKPENFLFKTPNQDDYNLSLIDFGCSTQVIDTKKYTAFTGMYIYIIIVLYCL